MENHQFQDISLIEENYFWYKARREIIEQCLKNRKLLDNVNKHVLEIGAANGTNINYFKKYFNEIIGFELNDHAREIAYHKYEIKLESGSLPYEINLAEKVDFIFLFDVLEHVEKDLQALTEIKKMLNKNGSLIITVPAYQFLFGKFDEISHHYLRYSLKTISDLLLKAGYKIRYKSYFNFYLFPLVLISRLFEKFKKTNGFVASDKRYGRINWMLYMIMRSEKYLMKFGIRFPFGSSIIIICE